MATIWRYIWTSFSTSRPAAGWRVAIVMAR